MFWIISCKICIFLIQTVVSAKFVNFGYNIIFMQGIISNNLFANCHSTPFQEFFCSVSFLCKICKLPYHHFAKGRSAFCILFQRSIAKLPNVALYLYYRSIVCKSPSQIVQHCFSKICNPPRDYIFAFAIRHCEPILLFTKFHSRSFLRKMCKSSW